MFDERSRYAEIETAHRELPDGRVVAFKRRRFLPRGAEMPVLTEVVTSRGDRLDRLAASVLGDSKQHWRILDANDAVRPGDLLRDPGRRVRVPIPEA